VIREIGHLRLKHRLVTTICTIGWIVIGLLLARWIAGSERSVAAVVFIIAATMSTWCWLGLLGLWPTLGKRQIYAADRFAAIHLGKADALVMLDVLASRNLPDRTLPSGVAFVFHPIPPMDLRRQRIKSLP
jgi:Zn-dependent protease with chaperone function